MKESNITISVRILKSDVAIARDRLVDLGFIHTTRTLSDVIRNTIAVGMVFMNNITEKSMQTKPSKESIDFINNIRRKKVGNINIDEMAKKLTGGKDDK